MPCAQDLFSFLPWYYKRNCEFIKVSAFFPRKRTTNEWNLKQTIHLLKALYIWEYFHDHSLFNIELHSHQPFHICFARFRLFSTHNQQKDETYSSHSRTVYCLCYVNVNRIYKFTFQQLSLFLNLIEKICFFILRNGNLSIRDKTFWYFPPKYLLCLATFQYVRYKSNTQIFFQRGKNIVCRRLFITGIFGRWIVWRIEPKKKFIDGRTMKLPSLHSHICCEPSFLKSQSIAYIGYLGYMFAEVSVGITHILQRPTR